MSDEDNVEVPVEGVYAVIAEKNSITGALRWSIGVWMQNRERVCSLCKVPHFRDMVGDETRPVESGMLRLVSVDGKQDFKGSFVTGDEYRTDLAPRRFKYASQDEAQGGVDQLNKQGEAGRFMAAWEIVNGT